MPLFKNAHKAANTQPSNPAPAPLNLRQAVAATLQALNSQNANPSVAFTTRLQALEQHLKAQPTQVGLRYAVEAELHYRSLDRVFFMDTRPLITTLEKLLKQYPVEAVACFDQLEAELQQQQRAGQVLQQRVDTVQTSNRTLHHKLVQVEEDYKTLQSAFDALKARLEQTPDELRQQLDKAQQQIQTLKATIKALQQKQAAFEQNEARLAAEKAQLTTAHDALRAENQQLSHENNQFKLTLKAVLENQEQVALQQANHQETVLDSLVRQNQINALMVYALNCTDAAQREQLNQQMLAMLGLPARSVQATDTVPAPSRPSTSSAATLTGSFGLFTPVTRAVSPAVETPVLAGSFYASSAVELQEWSSRESAHSPTDISADYVFPETPQHEVGLLSDEQSQYSPFEENSDDEATLDWRPKSQPRVAVPL